PAWLLRSGHRRRAGGGRGLGRSRRRWRGRRRRDALREMGHDEACDHGQHPLQDVGLDARPLRGRGRDVGHPVLVPEDVTQYALAGPGGLRRREHRRVVSVTLVIAALQSAEKLLEAARLGTALLDSADERWNQMRDRVTNLALLQPEALRELTDCLFLRHGF